jgi:hypothetical protein
MSTMTRVAFFGQPLGHLAASCALLEQRDDGTVFTDSDRVLPSDVARLMTQEPQPTLHLADGGEDKAEGARWRYAIDFSRLPVDVPAWMQSMLQRTHSA